MTTTVRTLPAARAVIATLEANAADYERLLSERDRDVSASRELIAALQARAEEQGRTIDELARRQRDLDNDLRGTRAELNSQRFRNERLNLALDRALGFIEAKQGEARPGGFAMTEGGGISADIGRAGGQIMTSANGAEERRR